jgi:hypothetical protein
VRFVRRIVASKILLYTLLLSYLVGLSLRGRICECCALLVVTIPFLIVLLAIFDSLRDRDYVTFLSGITLIVLLIIVRTGIL